MRGTWGIVGAGGHTNMPETPHMVSRCGWVLVEKAMAYFSDLAGLLLGLEVAINDQDL